ncbi:hypothetical protein RIR_e56850_A0A2N1N5A4_9GLOM [Rhizophagus irregularis DAOM 181602=DAOM 197198]|uniref:Uncharacterized protein n=1 Tax=Rhizophagus irregularis TaxID=588596 RepID=A0A2N1N5A4_9GLOM|nr:hypothetical protein RhiirC2_748990 [Rhizophagus irregularis]GET58389.1 hypothetical protein RIR_e56850_A0A2N1N5A4_9GLOM [Rhizophagus irregularis DAOM 181602=DAOM 197198]
MNERPAANSGLFLTLSPWLLCIVIAHARPIGTCKRERCVSFLPLSYYEYYKNCIIYS